MGEGFCNEAVGAFFPMVRLFPGYSGERNSRVTSKKTTPGTVSSYPRTSAPSNHTQNRLLILWYQKIYGQHVHTFTLEAETGPATQRDWARHEGEAACSNIGQSRLQR